MPLRDGHGDMTFQEQPGFCMMRLVRAGANREIITQTARTGIIGDGKIFVYSPEQVVNSHTGQTGTGAL
jgi:nitrogen regulatory protein PII